MQQKGNQSVDGLSTLSLLEDGLEALDLGLGIFDSDLQLIECNHLFRKIRAYPANLCQPGVSLRDLLSHDLAHGNLVDDDSDDTLGAWLDRAANRMRFSADDELKDGRIIATVMAPIGEQGVLITFADVTERSRADRALSASQEWHDLVTEASSEGIYDWNVRTNELKVSYRLTAMLGLSPGDLTSLDWAERVHPEDRKAYRAAIASHFKGETPYLKCEYRVRRKGGDYIWFSDSGKCVRNETGQAIRLVGAVSDITARMLAETSLKKSEERFTLAMQAINEGVYDWDIESNETFYSSGIRSALGLDPSQLKNSEDWFSRIHPDDAGKWRQALVDHFKRLTDRFDCEFRYRGPDGQWRWARQHGIAQFSEDGRAVRMIGATGDVTELQEQRAAAGEAREQLAKAIDSISEGFAIYDSEDRLVLCNGQYRSLYPGLEDVLVPGAAYEVVLRALAERKIVADVGDDIDAWVRERLEKHRNPGQPYESALSDKRWAKVAWRKTSDGGIVGVFTDITEMKNAEIALRQSDERYALATEAATEGIYDWDVAADRLIVSERLGAITALSSGALSSMEWNKRIHSRDRKKYSTAILELFKGKAPYLACEYRIRNGAGDYIWVTDSATCVRDDGGRVVRLVGAIADVTARKQAEMELQEAKQRTEDASQLAIEKARTLEALSVKLSKYLSPQVYSSIFSGEQSVEIDAKRKKLTIFFSDIVGFTALADVLESEELTALLNEYLTEMSRIALAHGATIDKFIGDAILAFFGDPDSKGPKEDAVACVKMAIAMQRRLREIQTKWHDIGLDRAFELRIGITTGFCTVGNFGSEDRMDYTVVGNEVNLAARLQSHAETGGILMSSETQALVKDAILSVDQGDFTMKGIPRPVRAYKVVGIYDELAESGEIIRLDQPGMRLLVNPAELAEEDRAEALKALELAAVRIKGGVD